MFTQNNYNEVLHESKSDHHTIGGAWSIVSIFAAVCLLASAANYLI